MEKTGAVDISSGVGAACLAIAFHALAGIEETIDKDLDCVEE